VSKTTIQQTVQQPRVTVAAQTPNVNLPSSLTVIDGDSFALFDSIRSARPPTRLVRVRRDRRRAIRNRGC
jgi:hypothetical protein